MNLFAGQQSKCRHAEQTCGQSTGRRRWKKLRDECWNTHITIRRPKLLLFSHSVAQSCPTLCDPVVCSTPGCTVQHQLLELAQTHVHWDGDAIQPSCPLSTPSLPAFNLSQHQRKIHVPDSFIHSFLMNRLFASGGQSSGASASASVLPMNIQSSIPLGLTGLHSLHPRDSQESFWKHRSIQSSCDWWL